MDIKATQKFVKIAPQKVRVVADLIRKLTPVKALSVLPYIKKKGSPEVAKVVKTALANARQAGFSEDTLVFKELQIGESVRLKRGIPVSRGMWHPIVKRMSHIRVVLTQKEEVVKVVEDKKVVKVEKETVAKKSNIKNQKSKTQTKKGKEK